MCRCLLCPLLGAWPETQAFALGNWTSDPLVHRPALNPLRHTSQSSTAIFQHQDLICEPGNLSGRGAGSSLLVHLDPMGQGTMASVGTILNMILWGSPVPFCSRNATMLLHSRTQEKECPPEEGRSSGAWTYTVSKNISQQGMCSSLTLKRGKGFVF